MTGRRRFVHHRMLQTLCDIFIWDPLMVVQDPPEYYNPPGGLLTFDLQLGDLVNKSVPVNGGVAAEDYIGHFDLVNAQLQQVGCSCTLHTTPALSPFQVCESWCREPGNISVPVMKRAGVRMHILSMAFELDVEC